MGNTWRLPSDQMTATNKQEERDFFRGLQQVFLPLPLILAAIIVCVVGYAFAAPAPRVPRVARTMRHR
jgi:hypothetical protein